MGHACPGRWGLTGGGTGQGQIRITPLSKGGRDDPSSAQAAGDRFGQAGLTRVS